MSLTKAKWTVGDRDALLEQLANWALVEYPKGEVLASLGDLRMGLDDFGGAVEIQPRRDAIVLRNLWVDGDLRRRGRGRRLMEWALAVIDFAGRPCVLDALPFGYDEPMDEEQLKAWFGQLGFVAVEGHPFAMRRPGRRRELEAPASMDGPVPYYPALQGGAA